MSRIAWFESPFLIGFDGLRLAAERVHAINDGFPPYNVEVVGEGHLRISIAVAGFALEDLHVEERGAHLVVEGGKEHDEQRQFVHRGIAGRRFRRVFVLADGFRTSDAELQNGLLTIDAKRPEPEEQVRNIAIKAL
jgi:HSP20 family molecular chaperone IbpA